MTETRIFQQTVTDRLSPNIISFFRPLWAISWCFKRVLHVFHRISAIIWIIIFEIYLILRINNQFFGVRFVRTTIEISHCFTLIINSFSSCGDVVNLKIFWIFTSLIESFEKSNSSLACFPRARKRRDISSYRKKLQPASWFLIIQIWICNNRITHTGSLLTHDRNS